MGDRVTGVLVTPISGGRADVGACRRGGSTTAGALAGGGLGGGVLVMLGGTVVVVGVLAGDGAGVVVVVVGSTWLPGAAEGRDARRTAATTMATSAIAIATMAKTATGLRYHGSGEGDPTRSAPSP